MKAKRWLMADGGRRSVLPDSGIGPFEIWQSGATLAGALDLFAGGRAWTARKSGVMARFHQLRTDPRSPMADRGEAMVRLQDLAEAWEDQARLLDEIRAGLVARLAVGELVALGFAGDTPATGRLAAIPAYVWQAGPAIDWDRSGIKGRDQSFSDIRVLPTPRNQLDGRRGTLGEV